jgi:2-methylcitrate dehydratase PrpD
VLDLDDGHRIASGHPGAAIIPAVLAEAAVRRSNIEEILLAIITGYEAGLRVARSRDPSRLTVVATGRWSPIGVAAAVAKLRRLPESVLLEALTIAEAHASNLIAADYAGFLEGDVKEGIPWSVIVGFAAVDLAQAGMRGYRSAFDNPMLYRPSSAASGVDAFLIETAYFKRYGCCRWAHSAIDAVLDIGSERPKANVVDTIEIATFKRAATLRNPTQPDDLIAAQFSVPFSVALAYEAGPFGLLPIFHASLHDKRISKLAEKIHITVDEDLEAAFPAQVPARVTIVANGSKIEREIRVPKGDPENPLSDDELTGKATRLTANVIAEDTMKKTAAALLSPNGGSSEMLQTLLAERAA